MKYRQDLGTFWIPYFLRCSMENLEDCDSSSISIYDVCYTYYDYDTEYKPSESVCKRFNKTAMDLPKYEKSFLFFYIFKFYQMIKKTDLKDGYSSEVINVC